VILAPGFGAGDQTLAVLASWLRRLGYAPATCGFVTNAGCSEVALERVEHVAAAASERSGRRVAVVGHSRGGHYARALAARRPDLVSHAVSLGADLRGMLDVSAPTLAAVALARRSRPRQPGCLTAGCACAFGRDFAAPLEPTVRLTSIYSKGDGVVRWQAQVVPDADCVEVTGSHVGLIFNRKSYRAIAAALAAPELERTP
jgi:pimeloyl-ACP methyl ester carboxylesterase